MTDALVVDLDGVLLLRDVTHRETIERRVGVPVGTLLEFAFTGAVFTDALLGRVPDEAWRTDVADRIAAEFGDAVRPAVQDWANSLAVVDHAVLELVRRQRLVRTVALLTNSTDRLPRELAALGLDGEFDAVFSSAHLGLAKPDPDLYRRVAEVLGTDDIAFVDDSSANVESAAAMGWRTHRYRDHEGLADFLLTFPTPETT